MRRRIFIDRRRWALWALVLAAALLALACAGEDDLGTTSASDGGGASGAAAVAPQENAASRGDVDEAAPGLGMGGSKAGVPPVGCSVETS